MRVTLVEVWNFASYDRVQLNFQNRGLTLVHGATGSGKSTLCDMVPWTLFGKTAKGGTVDEIRAWNPDKNLSNGATVGNVHIEGIPGISGIRRIRGSASANDLCYFTEDGTAQRGKDITDTQRIINEKIGMDLEQYLASSYFHEFSQTAGFFTASAKSRRLICEQIVDLSLPKKLAERVADIKKIANKELETEERNFLILETTKKTLESRLAHFINQAALWEKQQVAKLEDYIAKYNNYDQHLVAQSNVLTLKRQSLVDKLYKTIPVIKNAVCAKCGAPNKAVRDAEKMQHHNQLIEQQIANVDLQLANLSKENPFENLIEELRSQDNPHTLELKSLKEKITTQATDIKVAKELVDHIKEQITNYEILLESTAQLRAMVIEQAISEIEDTTNGYLSEYFDAEIKVEFKVDGADKLEVAITKDGNECSYTQLSKGQRQLLKLCFGIAVMKQSAQHSLVSISQLFFDEALDGMDEQLKVKAFSLFQALSVEYESVFVVEHSSAFKECFPNKLYIQLIEGTSAVTE